MLRIMFMGFQKTNLWGRLGTRLLTPNEHQSLLRRAVGLFLKLMWNEGADMECVRPNDNHALQSSYHHASGGDGQGLAYSSEWGFPQKAVFS